MPVVDDRAAPHHVHHLPLGHAMSCMRVIAVQVGLPAVPHMAQTKKVADLVKVRVELGRGVRNHLLDLDVLLAVQAAVRSEIFRIRYAHDRDV